MFGRCEELSGGAYFSRGEPEAKAFRLIAGGHGGAGLYEMMDRPLASFYNRRHLVPKWEFVEMLSESACKSYLGHFVAACLGAWLAITTTRLQPIMPRDHAPPKANGEAAGAVLQNVQLPIPGSLLPPREALAPLRAAALPMSPEEQINVAVYEKCHRSVVNIRSKSVQVQNLAFFEVEVPSEGAGSGFVVDKKGHIVTNYHVVEDAKEVDVTLDGVTYPAEVVGADPASDIAVLRIAALPEALSPLELGDSRGLKEGRRVFAIGNPFGLERTFSEGIVSSLNRSISSRDRVRTKIKNVIQMDMSINPGNSGGPLLDASGRLIGMNTAIASVTGQSAGVGFAVPVSTINQVLPQLIEFGKVVRPKHGIVRVSRTEQGLMVLTLEPNGPAEKAGLQGVRLMERRVNKGGQVFITRQLDMSHADVIVAVDGQKVTEPDEFLSLIDGKRPNDVVKLTVIRGERELTVPVTLGRDED